MNNFYKYLLLQKLLPGSSEQQIAGNIDKGVIDHNDVVDAFFSWLQDDTTIFIVLEKPKN